MFPSNGSQIVAQQTATWLAEHKEYTDITVHGFSVGGYLFGEVLNAINKNKHLQDSIIDRVRVQIFDSIVAMKEIPTAFPRAIASNPALIKGLELYSRTHLMLLKSIAVQHYENSYYMFCNHNFKVPSLFMMSEADKLCSTNDILQIIKKWKDAGMNVDYKLWEKSPHCSHYLHYPQDYMAAVAQLLESVGLLQDRSKLPALE